MNDHREWPFELARDGREITGELVGVLTHDAASVEVVDDSAQEIRIRKQAESFFSLCFGDRRRRATGGAVRKPPGVPERDGGI